MTSICFFIATTGFARNDNHRRLPAACAAQGMSVHVVDHDALGIARGALVLADGRALDDFDLVWPIGLGRQDTFLDRMQMLAGRSSAACVVDPLALLHLHGKYALPLGPLADHHPETHASRDADHLAAIVARGGEWIAKPPAASFGRDVYRLHAADSNLRAILSSLTGHDGSRYCLVQRYVPEIERGETRVLVAGGEIVAAYLRTPVGDHRANLAAGAQAMLAVLSPNERTLAQRSAEWLARQGVHWAAVDIAYPWIVEFNIANPGGLETIERLSGVDHAPEVVAKVERALCTRNAPADNGGSA